MTSLIYSPLTGELLGSTYNPIPRSAFIMCSQNSSTSAVESRIIRSTKKALRQLGIKPVSADETISTIDFLQKIINLIRATGFSVAIYSEQTDFKTFGNIFYEIAIAHLLGRDLIRLVAGPNPSPSDLGRNEYIYYDPSHSREAMRKLRMRVRSIIAASETDFKMGCFQIEKSSPDFEAAVHLFQRAVLITEHADSGLKLKLIEEILANLPNCEARQQHVRLYEAVAHFNRTLPKYNAVGE